MIGTTVRVRHVLTVQVVNRGEAPEYVYEVNLENQAPSPITVAIRKGDGSVEVRPRDLATFDLGLDGSQAFGWDEPFRAVVSLAGGQVFRSDFTPQGLLNPPCHGTQTVVRDSDEVPDEEVIRVCLDDLSPE